jgi:hypothetical protein
MNKYLKTYIRNREIAIERQQNLKEYELGYIDISKLNFHDIKSLLETSSEHDKVIYILLKNKEFLSKIYNTDNVEFNLIFFFSKERDKIINILLNDKEFLSKLDSNGITRLLVMSSEPENVINILDKKGKEYISNIDKYFIEFLLISSKEPEKIINILGDKGKNFISNLIKVEYLLKSSKEPNKIMNILGNKGKEYIYKLERVDIQYLINFSNNPEEIKQIIKKYRPDLNIE